MFHMWTGLTIISAAIGRKCYTDWGYYRIYPNLYTILVAGAARCRKSTAVDLGVDLLKEIPGMRVISGKITPEKFIQELLPKKDEEDVNVLIHADELSVFLTKQNYGEPLIYVLTQLYNCPKEFTYKTLQKEVSLRNIYVCIIAATTPDGIARGIPQSALEDGFASRILFPFQADTDKEPNPLPFLTQSELDLRAELVRSLARISTLKGEFQIEQVAREWYIAWYKAMLPPADKRLEGMFARKHAHMLRIGTLFAAAEERTEICVGDFEAADAAIDFLEKSAPGAFAEMGGDDKTPLLTRARTYIERLRRIGHSEFLRMMWPVRADVFRVIVETLLDSGVMMRDPGKASFYVLRSWYQNLTHSEQESQRNQDNDPGLTNSQNGSPGRSSSTSE